MKAGQLRLAVLIAVGAVGWSGAAEPAVIPKYKAVQTLVDSTLLAEKKYPAFPVLLPLGETNLLIGLKRGDSHATGDEAAFELLHFNPTTRRVSPDRTVLRQPKVILQNGEFVRFGNRDIACYLDVQAAKVTGQKAAVSRLGLIEYRSTDGGRTFKDMGKVGLIDGVEYGYAFEAITEGPYTWMLVMNFTNLPGGKPIPSGRATAGSVDVIWTHDHGKKWHFMQNLSHELGDLPINESSILRYRDGFIISTRGYDNHQWLHLVNGEFKMQRQMDLTRENAFIRSYVGRPRLFARNGGYYLLGRNFIGDAKADFMKLSLFRFDPETFGITKHVILDNAENERVTDGYYAVPYWQEGADKTFFNLITYKKIADRTPDILRLEYRWDEVK
jgi:hypothetical protein